MPNRLGLDVGFSETGFALLNLDDKRLLAWGELNHRNIRNSRDVAGRMEKRRSLRSTRRSRKWYRPKRFDNRKRNKINLDKEIVPTFRSHLAAHLKLIRFLLDRYSIDEIAIELGQFDPHKLKKGRSLANWEYQQGEKYGYENQKAYVRERDNYTCQYCGDSGGTVDHILSQTDYPHLKRELTNMVCACKSCQNKKGKQTAEEFGFPEMQEKVKKKESQKSSTGMNYLNTLLWDYLEAGALYVEKEECEKHKGEYNFNPILEETFGYITREDREKNTDWPKTDRHDAAIIATMGEEIELPPKYLKMKWTGRPTRQNTREEYSEGHVKEGWPKYSDIKVNGTIFNRGDLVRYEARDGIVYEGFIQSLFANKRARITSVLGKSDLEKSLEEMSTNGKPERKSWPVAKLSSMEKIADSPRLRYKLVS